MAITFVDIHQAHDAWDNAFLEWRETLQGEDDSFVQDHQIAVENLDQAEAVYFACLEEASEEIAEAWYAK